MPYSALGLRRPMVLGLRRPIVSLCTPGAYSAATYKPNTTRCNAPRTGDSSAPRQYRAKHSRRRRERKRGKESMKHSKYPCVRTPSRLCHWHSHNLPSRESQKERRKWREGGWRARREGECTKQHTLPVQRLLPEQTSQDLLAPFLCLDYLLIRSGAPVHSAARQTIVMSPSPRTSGNASINNITV